MLRMWFGCRARAFSLVELLCALAIITVLAALVLPVVARGRERAWRIQCVSHLHQVGIAFHGFAHEHNSRFPMAVPANAGGSRELAENAYRAGTCFYFAFRHFQTLSNELATPRLLVCPADTRLPASDFRALTNENVSYFVGLNAEYARPNSLLAGDRSVTNDWTTASTLVRLGGNSSLRWTHELHRFKGNLLFADGRVEEKNQTALIASLNQVPPVAELALPTARPVAGISRPAVGSAGTVQSHLALMNPENAAGAGKGQTSPPTPSTRTDARSTRGTLALSVPKTASGVSPVAPQPSVRLGTNPLAGAGGKPWEVAPSDSPTALGVTATVPTILPGGLVEAVRDFARQTAWLLFLLLAVVVAGMLALRRLVHGRTRGGKKPEHEGAEG